MYILFIRVNDMSEFELENKSEMVYMKEKIDEPHITPYTTKKTFIVKQDPVTGDWNATIFKMDENNN